MTEKQFQEKWQISREKLLKMAPYIAGAKQCPNRQKWEFPDNAVAIYIPDKREYKKNIEIKKYAHVIDAIGHGMELSEELSGVSDDVLKTIVRELKKEGCIVLIEGKDERSLYHLDYVHSWKLATWKELKAAQKRELLTQVIRLTGNAIELMTTGVKMIAGA